jgi:hypothetical protein
MWNERLNVAPMPPSHHKRTSESRVFKTTCMISYENIFSGYFMWSVFLIFVRNISSWTLWRHNVCVIASEHSTIKDYRVHNVQVQVGALLLRRPPPNQHWLLIGGYYFVSRPRAHAHTRDPIYMAHMFSDI